MVTFCLQRQITAALIHPQQSYDRRSYSSDSGPTSDQTSIERLPEENVSIVETLENREDRPDALKAITGTTRRKLYFNPAYFEPQNLLVSILVQSQYTTTLCCFISDTTSCCHRISHQNPGSHHDRETKNGH